MMHFQNGLRNIPVKLKILSVKLLKQLPQGMQQEKPESLQEEKVR